MRCTWATRAHSRGLTWHGTSAGQVPCLCGARLLVGNDDALAQVLQFAQLLGGQAAGADAVGRPSLDLIQLLARRCRLLGMY